MPKRILTLLVCIIALSLSGFAAPKKSAKKAMSNGLAPDKAHLQKIWDGWSTFNTASRAILCRGPHDFRYRTPKYSLGGGYEKGNRDPKNYKSGKFTERRCRDP